MNALNLFYTYGRGSELQNTLYWVQEVLRNRAYLDGTRYYDTPECFLYFLSRLLASSDDQNLHEALMPLLKERVQERIGVEGDALTLAMRILVTDFVGIRNEVDLRALLPLQCVDGGWEIGWMCKYGSSGLRIGNRGLTTALAIKAVESMSTPPIPRQSPVPTLMNPESPSASPISRAQCKSSHRRKNSLKESLQWLWNRRGGQETCSSLSR